MHQSDDRRQLILEAGRRFHLPQGQMCVLKRLEHSERLVEIEDEPWRNRIIAAARDPWIGLGTWPRRSFLAAGGTFVVPTLLALDTPHPTEGGVAAVPCWSLASRP